MPDSNPPTQAELLVILAHSRIIGPNTLSLTQLQQTVTPIEPTRQRYSSYAYTTCYLHEPACISLRGSSNNSQRLAAYSSTTCYMKFRDCLTLSEASQDSGSQGLSHTGLQWLELYGSHRLCKHRSPVARAFLLPQTLQCEHFCSHDFVQHLCTQLAACIKSLLAPVGGSSC